MLAKKRDFGALFDHFLEPFRHMLATLAPKKDPGKNDEQKGANPVTQAVRDRMGNDPVFPLKNIAEW